MTCRSLVRVGMDRHAEVPIFEPSPRGLAFLTPPDATTLVKSNFGAEGAGDVQKAFWRPFGSVLDQPCMLTGGQM